MGKKALEKRKKRSCHDLAVRFCAGLAYAVWCDRLVRDWRMPFGVWCDLPTRMPYNARYCANVWRRGHVRY
eukprot:3604764-Rhodomonas_salina.1